MSSEAVASEINMYAAFANKVSDRKSWKDDGGLGALPCRGRSCSKSVRNLLRSGAPMDAMASSYLCSPMKYQNVAFACGMHILPPSPHGNANIPRSEYAKQAKSESEVALRATHPSYRAT